MNVEHLMSHDIETCTPEATLSDASMIMWRRDCGIVPVAQTPGGRFLGVITDRDICIATATRNRAPSAIRVKDVMAPRAFACAPGDKIRTALHRMSEAQVRRLPVVDNDGRVVGMLSLNDLALAAEENLARGAEGVTYADVVGVLKAVSAHRTPAPAIAGTRR